MVKLRQTTFKFHRFSPLCLNIAENDLLYVAELDRKMCMPLTMISLFSVFGCTVWVEGFLERRERERNVHVKRETESQ